MNEPDKQITESSNKETLTELSDKNWLFIKHFLVEGDITTAYQKAGYDGTARSAPYELFRRLKPYIEEIVNSELTAKIKFNDGLKKALSIPLVDKEALTVSEWLRIRKFASSLIPELKEDKSKLSVLVFNRYKDQVDTGDSGNGTNPTSPSISKDVIIDATIVPPSNE